MTIPESATFKQLFYQHYPAVLRKLTGLLGDKAIAEDLAQETFLKMYRQPPDQLDSAGAWLHRVATRLAYDYMGSAARQRKLTERQELLLGAEGAASPSGEEELIRQLDQEEVRGWLQQLPERDRKALLLRYSGYTYAEIAHELSIRPPVVGTLLARATERLRKRAGESAHMEQESSLEQGLR
ncbi:RNA polymerase subunit sigma-24 [Paenibacillus yonginensis]|uniref:RNA polymerase subunit sigma-24 n=1 Tax=Paenibacillus yonginensis TaxID=1462996 RepID=A0A1B1N7J6_9BACL|nr:sigma-70 family RNA polymerase sigma factor [Paenibacillus yonginensis]ANS77384.1 RNA polymerase subunit sigma-24 [Paenibacillus yonginensis]